MGRVFFLGTGAALPSADQDNSSLLFESNGSYVMVDCSGLPYRKLLKLGFLQQDMDRLQHVIISHLHIDHCLGLPSLIECLWIAGRDAPLHIYALKVTLDIIVPLLDLWQLRSRARNFPIIIHTIEGKVDEPVLKTDDFEIRTTPTHHAVPSIATKVIFPNAITCVYSSDTAPCQELTDFARGADYFFMECTYCDADDELAVLTGHTHPSEWGSIASIVAARNTLIMHHSTTADCSHDALVREIGPHYTGRVLVPRDLDILDLA